jgi:hypothetical protein
MALKNPKKSTKKSKKSKKKKNSFLIWKYLCEKYILVGVET